MEEPTIKYFDQSRQMIHELTEMQMDVSSDLRPIPTQLNYVRKEHVNTALYGTSAFLGKGVKGNLIDRESEVKLNKLNEEECDYNSEKKWHRELIGLDFDAALQSQPVPSSSRSDYRNMLQTLKQ